tara:strand:+ start:36117 stop:36764 length:648 start_codon:yes stop_codon:yes gene_type:complete
MTTATRPIIRNLVFDGLGYRVMGGFYEQFKDTRERGTSKEGVHIRDCNIYLPENPIAFPTTPRILGYNQILRNETDGRVRIPTLFEVLHYQNDIPEKDKFGTETSSLALSPNEGSKRYLRNLRRKVLDILGRKEIEDHLIVSGLGVEKDKGGCGFTFKETPYIEVKGSPVHVPPDQTGLRRIVLTSESQIDATDENLFSPKEDYRIRVIEDPITD